MKSEIKLKKDRKKAGRALEAAHAVHLEAEEDATAHRALAEIERLRVSSLPSGTVKKQMQEAAWVAASEAAEEKRLHAASGVPDDEIRKTRLKWGSSRLNAA